MEGQRAEVQASVTLSRQDIISKVYASRGWSRLGGQPAVYGLDPADQRWKVLPPLPTQLVNTHFTTAMGIDETGEPFVVLSSSSLAQVVILRFQPDGSTAPDPNQLSGSWTWFQAAVPPISSAFQHLTISGPEVMFTDKNRIYSLRVGSSQAFSSTDLTSPFGGTLVRAHRDGSGRLLLSMSGQFSTNPIGGPGPGRGVPLPPSPQQDHRLHRYDPTDSSWAQLFEAPAQGDSLSKVLDVLTDGTVIGVNSQGQLGRISGDAFSPLAGAPVGSVKQLRRDEAGGFYAQFAVGGGTQMAHYDGRRWSPVAEPPAMIYNVQNTGLIPIGNISPVFSTMAVGGGDPELQRGIELLWEF